MVVAPLGPTSSATSRKRTMLTAGALAIGSLALYVRSIDFGFVNYDDSTVLLGHPALYDEGSLLRSVREIFHYFPREEPLLVRDLSWALDSRVFGFRNAFGYHLGNVLLNAANAALAFLFLQRATRRFEFAAWVAALWACLAIHVEPVCWVMGRKDVLSAMFALLAFWAQAVALSSETRRARWLAETAVFFLYPLAVLSKFSAVALVAALAMQRMFAERLDGRLAPDAPVAWRTVVPRLLALYRLHRHEPRGGAHHGVMRQSSIS